ncbi:hypothetical protein ELI55_27050 (plasmid) [Rhizobium ruizarguesonis]|uniref:hypothetical protein n=1 Tax=Rhizobium ruizarguesonis TaxID=2081791 RepID=UPI0010323EB1|nr:hypothetical protein [Rhizobium ruizarguesonis]TAT96174.1 hypothetical protein ELI55_27050 [Rhizobium ruizarguesonis]
MEPTEMEKRRERAVLRLLTGAVAMGHLPLAKHWLEKKADVLRQLQLPECRIAYEGCSSDIARMEEIEKIHGSGAALVLSHPSVAALVKNSLIPDEIIRRSKSSGQLYSPPARF